MRQRQEWCSKGAVKLREVKVKEAKERRVASASLVAKKATSRRSALCAGTCPRRYSETGGIPYRLRRTKAKAKAQAEEKVARVKERGAFGILHPQMGMMEESEYSQSAYSDYNYEQNNDRERQQIGLLRQVNKRENDIKKIKVEKEISKPLFNFELLRSEEEGAANLSIGQSPHGQTVHMIRSPPESSKDDVRRHTCVSCKSPQANMTYSVGLKDLVVEKKCNIKKNKVVHFVEGFSKKKNAIVVKDEDEVDHIINEHRRVASLTMASDSIAPCTNKVGWKKVSLAIDSGACDNVIDAEELLPDYKVHQTKASTSGMKYASATGEEIPKSWRGNAANDNLRGHKEEDEDASGSSIEASRER